MFNPRDTTPAAVRSMFLQRANPVRQDQLRDAMFNPAGASPAPVQMGAPLRQQPISSPLESRIGKSLSTPTLGIEDLIRVSDLVIVDYGSSVLEGIYLNKRIAFYEWPHKKDFEIFHDKENCLDYIIREKFDFKFLKHIEGKRTNLIIKNIISDKTYLDGIKNLETKLFGSQKIKFDPKVIIDRYYDQKNY